MNYKTGKKSMPNQAKQAGFSLVELMIAITIIGIMTAMVTTVFVGKDDKARVQAAKTDIRSITQALDLYKLDNYSYPSSDEGLAALVTAPAGAKNWDPSGYLGKVPKDPWGNEYVYFGPDGTEKQEVVSLGADGQEGGEGFDADISSLDDA